MNDQHKDWVDRDTSFFLGVPDRKLIVKEGEDGEEQPPPEEANESGGEEGKP